VPNFLGVRYGAWVVNLLTVGKLLPLLLFIFVGLFFVDGRSYSFSVLPSAGSLGKASLVLFFAFGGFEFDSVPSEEVVNSRRNTPISILAAITFTAVLYILIQIVALGTLPELATSATPLASAARRFLGPLGGSLLTVGAILSTTGTNSAQVLVGPRMIYALAKDGELPRILARLHPRYRTPHISILLFSLCAWVFAAYSNFVQLAALNVLARLPYYISTCLAVPVLRHTMPQSKTRRKFTVRGGLLVPVLASLACVWMLTGSSLSQAIVAGMALLLGAVVYLGYSKPSIAASPPDSGLNGGSMTGGGLARRLTN
jgi:amino acid transporter